MSDSWQIAQSIGTCLGAFATFMASVVSLYIAFWSNREKFKGNIEIDFYTKDTPEILSDKNANTITPTNCIAKIFFNINNIRNTNSTILFNELFLSKTEIFLNLPNIKIINRQKIFTSLISIDLNIFDLIESKIGYLYTERGTKIKLPIKIKFNNFKALIENKLETLGKELEDYENYKPLKNNDAVSLVKINECIYTYNFLYTILKYKKPFDVIKYARIFSYSKIPSNNKEILETYNKIKNFKEYIEGRSI